MRKNEGGDTMTLGDKLAKLRREYNYTQEQLAELLGGIPAGHFQMGIQWSLPGDGEADPAG